MENKNFIPVDILKGKNMNHNVNHKRQTLKEEKNSMVYCNYAEESRNTYNEGEITYRYISLFSDSFKRFLSTSINAALSNKHKTVVNNNIYLSGVVKYYKDEDSISFVYKVYTKQDNKNDILLMSSMKTRALGFYNVFNFYSYDLKHFINNYEYKVRSLVLKSNCIINELDTIKCLSNQTERTLFDYVDHVIDSDPITIVFFKDGSKEISKCSKGDKYDVYKGIMICIIKRLSTCSQTKFSKEYDELESKITKKKLGEKKVRVKKKPSTKKVSARGISDNITNELCRNGFSSLFDLVDRIYLADPKTIVIFKDGTKSIVTCSKGDTYNRTAGILLCIMKRFYPGTQTQFSKGISALEEKAEFPQMSNKEFKIAKKKFEKALKKTSESF